MKPTTGLPVERFLQTLEIVMREGKHLSYSWNSLFSQTINAKWMHNLEHDPDCAEKLEAFVSRFGRMQDTMPDKLLRRCLLALAEMPGSQFETLTHAERVGVLTSTE